MEEVKTINMDGIEYIVADEILIDDIKYIYLSNENDPIDFIIQKIEIDNNEEYLVKLKDEEEFDKALQVFFNKHKDTLN